MLAHSYMARIVSCRQIIKELSDTLNQDRSPLGNSRPQSNISDPSFQRHMTHFSLITHGFGSPAIVAAISAVQNYLSELVKCVDKSTTTSTAFQTPLSGGDDVTDSVNNKPNVRSKGDTGRK